MAWDRQQAQEANEKEERWMSFMRDMFSMLQHHQCHSHSGIVQYLLIPHSNTQPGTNMEE